MLHVVNEKYSALCSMLSTRTSFAPLLNEGKCVYVYPFECLYMLQTASETDLLRESSVCPYYFAQNKVHYSFRRCRY